MTPTGNMDEREGWQAMMIVWESWKRGGYTTYDAIIIETLCGSVDENPIVVDGRPLLTCPAIESALQVAVDNRAEFRTAKGAMSYVERVIKNARDDGRWPTEKPKAFKRRPQTREEERRKLGLGDRPSARTPPIF